MITKKKEILNLTRKNLNYVFFVFTAGSFSLKRIRIRESKMKRIQTELDPNADIYPIKIFSEICQICSVKLFLIIKIKKKVHHRRVGNYALVKKRRRKKNRKGEAK